MSDERGSVTLWILGLCMVVLAVGGISLDLWRAFSGFRELATVADAAAIAGASGVDTDQFRLDGTVQLDPAQAASLAVTVLGEEGIDSSNYLVSPSPAAITVEVSGDIPFILLRLLVPDEGIRLTAAATSVPVAG